MAQEIGARLDGLKAEYEKGQVRLQQLESELKVLRDTMLRISGAIQVLEELRQASAMPAEFDTSMNGKEHESPIAKIS